MSEANGATAETVILLLVSVVDELVGVREFKSFSFEDMLVEPGDVAGNAAMLLLASVVAEVGPGVAVWLLGSSMELCVEAISTSLVVSVLETDAGSWVLVGPGIGT